MADGTDQTTQDTGTDTAEEPAGTALTGAEDEGAGAGAEPHGGRDRLEGAGPQMGETRQSQPREGRRGRPAA